MSDLQVWGLIVLFVAAYLLFRMLRDGTGPLPNHWIRRRHG